MGNILTVVSELAPTLMKYSEIQPDYINIKVTELEKGSNILITSDKPEVSKALSELMLMMAKISETGNTKVSVEVD
jgi:hypothetical protein